MTRASRLDQTPHGGTVRKERMWLLESANASFDPLAAAAALRATGRFAAVVPNFSVHLLATYPSDIWLPYQWYVDDASFADIRLPFAWDIEKGSSSVVIAIIDTGVDTSHPDLATQIWHNPGEIAGNGLDDDGNGYVDDADGWDFGRHDNDPRPEYSRDDSTGIDIGFHGTFCAGIAAAATNNDDGIAGAGWNCRIMALKASHPDSTGLIYASAVAPAIAYAVDEGASIISMSFGDFEAPGLVQFYQTLVDMANQAGVLCVAAAGNEGDDVPIYPAGCERVLAVAATDFNNDRAEFSNWGSYVDIAAPGSSMWSTICQNYTFLLSDQIVYLFLGWDTVNPYMYGDGTSFSTPLVAGVAGLVRSRFPNLNPAMVRQHLIATGDVLAFDHPIGPKVNAFQAVNSVPTAVEQGEAPRLMLTAAPNPAAGGSEIRFTLEQDARVRISMFDASGRRVRSLVDGPLAAGPHRIAWDGRTDVGSSLGAGVYLVKLETGVSTRTMKLAWMGR
ncbi:MAG TPA: S8 family serine peptidase [Candidatus Eisenbacteria bacterium]|nr:S8 family serine peptidase [Candidatus Eisenbacteria bacterium]